MDASELEAALRGLLVRYEDVLELSEIYGIQVLHRRGARAHDWFAGVRPGKGSAKLMLLPIKAHPELLDDTSGRAPEASNRRRPVHAEAR